ncbi:hypothetical protein [Lysobacter brunescens]|uniref:Uncharacterized protein n=1 Tax=Lysobacter brunescens TaxID=262323 RepID=A0ABW2YGC3_9GAMM
MIKMIWPIEIDAASGNPVNLLSAHGEIEKIEMNLHIWVERIGINEKVRFAYTPGSDARFMTNKKIQTLSIKLISSELHRGAQRFRIIGHATQDSEFIVGATGKKGGNPLPEDVGSHPNKFPLGASSDISTTDADEIVITLSLNMHMDTTYISIIVLDSKTSAIIDCDPQVENGTKT